MEILNYTGEAVGLLSKTNTPLRVLPSVGKAVVNPIQEELYMEVDGIEIHSKRKGVVKGLPPPSGNLDPMYIVTRDVAEAARSTRFDLLIVDELIERLGAKFYKKIFHV